jgi:hypothetical protein
LDIRSDSSWFSQGLKPSNPYRWDQENLFTLDEVWNAVAIDGVVDPFLQDGAPKGEQFVQAAAAAIYSSGWDALTFVGEFHELPALYMGVKERLIRALSRDGKGFPRKWRYKRILKQIRSDYMEGRYGWRPLWYDLQDLAALVVGLREERFTRYKKRVGADTSSSSDILLHKSGYHYSAGDHDRYYSVVLDVQAGYRGSVAADILPPRLQIDADVTLWELTRLSFVFDWFINVGQALNAMHFLATQTNSTAARGMRVKVVGECNAWAASNSADVLCGATLNQGALSYTYNLRQPIKVPMAPIFKLRLDPLKILDLIAIVSQLRR